MLYMHYFTQSLQFFYDLNIVSTTTPQITNGNLIEVKQSAQSHIATTWQSPDSEPNLFDSKAQTLDHAVSTDI